MCGIFGCVTCEGWTGGDVCYVVEQGLSALQHRGQESGGISVSTGDASKKPLCYRAMGLLSQVFDQRVMDQLKPGCLGIGHTRYSTMGGSELENCQPYNVQTSSGYIAMAHNGELVNSKRLKNKLLSEGIALTTGSDTELITHVLLKPMSTAEQESMASSEYDRTDQLWAGRFRRLSQFCQLAYSILLMHGDRIYAVRDPFGNRPLCLARIDSPEDAGKQSKSVGYAVSSESCSFSMINATLIRDLVPGEIVSINRSENCYKSLAIVPVGVGTVEWPLVDSETAHVRAAFCIFEYVYFARPDSVIDSRLVYSVRQRCGERLADESSVAADIVSTVPESATPATLGYSRRSGVPYQEVFYKNKYVGRSFIQPNTSSRRSAVDRKFTVLDSTPVSPDHRLQGKRIILVDDSIVRGTTMKGLVRKLKRSGALEVHIRVASPPLKHPCFMGINIPTRDELVANSCSQLDLAASFGADSLAYLSVPGLVDAVLGVVSNGPIDQSDYVDVGLKESRRGFCTACLTGHYPVSIDIEDLA